MKERKQDGNKRLPATGYLLELFANFLRILSCKGSSPNFTSNIEFKQSN